MQTNQQLRAASALKAVEGLLKNQGDTAQGKKLRTRASELPFMIHANGLGQAAAFFKSQGDEHGYGDVYRILENWLIAKEQIFRGRPSLLEGITKGSMQDYMTAQAEAMLYMDWVKKFARAFVSGK